MLKKNKGLKKRLRQQEFIHFANYGHPKPSLMTPEEFKFNQIWFRRGESERPEALQKLRILLDRIIRTSKLVDCEELQYFIKHWEPTVSQLKITKRGLEMYWIHSPEIYRGVCYDPYWMPALVNSLIDFLIKGNLKKLRKCRWCEDYFIASRDDRRIMYCGECAPLSKIGKEKQREAQKKHRDKKKQQREAEKAKTRENTIRLHMKALSISREEAERLWRDDRA
jgi:hypothetical protein